MNINEDYGVTGALMMVSFYGIFIK